MAIELTEDFLGALDYLKFEKPSVSDRKGGHRQVNARSALHRDN